MRIPFGFNGLRSVIITSLTLLILAAMLLINVVMAVFAQRDLIDERVRRAHFLVAAVDVLLRENHKADRVSKGFPALAPEFRDRLNRLVQASGFSGLLLTRTSGNRVYGIGPWTEREKKQAATRSKPDGGVRFVGKTWGWLWPAPEKFVMTKDLTHGSQRIGSVAVLADLKPLYQKLRDSEPLILAYIALNVFILVLFGIGLLSFTIIRPIHRMLQITEQVDGDIPSFEKGVVAKNEIGRLSRSLSVMLRRLGANEKRLKQNIDSLKCANAEIQKAHNEMVKSEKMASIGRLATGIAHEIGNPLGIILGYVELLERGDLKKAERDDFLKRLESEVRRIHRIIRDLLDFSRPSVHDQQNGRAHEVIEDVLRVLSPQSLFEDIDIRCRFDAENQIVAIGPDTLKQIFLNILLNAVDAMALRPKPSIKPLPVKSALSEPAEPPVGILKIRTVNEDKCLSVDFDDSGCGIGPENLSRVFDPFFTTKQPGKGTGLGLSICYTILERVGGTIGVESEPGRGTVVTLKIPVATG